MRAFEFPRIPTRFDFYAVRNGDATGAGFIEFNMAERWILKLDASLRAGPDVVRAVSNRGSAMPMREADDPWIPLWPPMSQGKTDGDSP